MIGFKTVRFGMIFTVAACMSLACPRPVEQQGTDDFLMLGLISDHYRDCDYVLSGNYIACDRFAHLSGLNQVSILAGPVAGTVAAGHADGTGASVRFNFPAGSAYYNDALYVADWSNNRIRKIDLLTNETSTFSGDGTTAVTDGVGTAAQHNIPSAITIDDSGNAYIAECGGNVIRQLDLISGQVTTIAGTAGAAGSADGVGTAASFSCPGGVVLLGHVLYVSDTSNDTIRKIDLNTREVFTVIGSAGVTGSTDGEGQSARLNQPYNMTTDGTGLYWGEFPNHAVRTADVATFTVRTMAGTGVAGFVDGTGTAAQFNQPVGLAYDGVSLYVGQSAGIRKIDLTSEEVTTIGTTGAANGDVDGATTDARYNSDLRGLTVGVGGLYTSDRLNHKVKKIFAQ